VMAVTGVSAALSQGLFSGALVRLFGESRTVAIGLCCTGAALAAQAGAPAPLVAIVCLTAAVAGHGLTLPAMSSLVSRSASSETQGATLGANAATGSLARVAGPVIAGGLFSAVGLYAPGLFAAVGMLPAAWLAWRAGRRLRL
jgi:MFS transporter, DHA1 family, tetracycline resistance protein